MEIARHQASEVLAALRDTPVVFLQGARQTGKSTLVQALTEREYPARYITLDDATVLASARGDPQGFVSGLARPVIIDEVQRVPELALAIKASVDSKRKPGSFLLTGSADVLLLPKLAEALVGRLEIQTLWPFSQGELDGHRDTFVDDVFRSRFSLPRPSRIDRADLIDRVLRGGFPEVIERRTRERRRAWYESYITTLLHREVRDMANIQGLTEIPSLLAFLASRVGSLLNYTQVSRSLSMPQTTVKRYIALLEATFLIQLLPAWSANLGKRLVKSPKLNMIDTGLVSHLLDLDQKRLVRDATLFGHLCENFVIMELRKQISWSRARPRVCHFRTHSGREVDALLESSSGQVVGVEVKASETVRAEDFRGLRTLAEATTDRFLRGVLFYGGKESVSFGKNLHALPINALWSH
jgi:predicted AAA+ superfamily ATPase